MNKILSKVFYGLGMLLGVIVMSIVCVAFSFCFCVVPYLIYTFLPITFSPVLIWLFGAIYLVTAFLCLYNFMVRGKAFNL